MSTAAGRTVVVTGASGAIGSELALLLAREGARVLAVGRSVDRLGSLVARGPAGRIEPVVADLATEAGCAHVVSRAVVAPVSWLVLAHAQPSFGLFAEASPQAMEQLVATNLLAPMRLVHGLLPALARHPGAAVVAVGSTFGSLAFPGFAAYSSTKFGLRGLIEALAREHADGPVRFQYLSPRATRSAFNGPRAEALNRELGVREDEPADVARQLLAAMHRGDARRQLGWPEKLFTRLNGLLPGLVDRSLRKQLPVVRRHAFTGTHPDSQETLHEAPSV